MPRNGAPPRKPARAKHRLAKVTTPAPLPKGERRVELDLWGTDELPGFTLTAKGLSIQGTGREFEALIERLKSSI